MLLQFTALHDHLNLLSIIGAMVGDSLGQTGAGRPAASTAVATGAAQLTLAALPLGVRTVLALVRALNHSKHWDKLEQADRPHPLLWQPELRNSPSRLCRSEFEQCSLLFGCHSSG